MICHFTVGNTTSVPPQKVVMLCNVELKTECNHLQIMFYSQQDTDIVSNENLYLIQNWIMAKKGPSKNVFSIFSIRFINICKVRRPDAGLLSHSCLIKDFSCSKILDLLSHIFCVMMCQMFPACERSGLLAGQFSTNTLLL